MSLYEIDFYSWTRQQAELLRTGKLDRADIENIAEEIEDLGESKADALQAAYRLISSHLLILMFQPKMVARSWLLTIVQERNNLTRILRKNLGLQFKRDALFDDGYADARKEAAAETGLPLNLFPIDPPFTREQADDEAFMPPPSA